MFALQIRKSSKDIERVRKGFNSPDEFVKWAADAIYSLAPARRKAQALLNEIRQLREIKAHNKIYDDEINKLPKKSAKL